eukprot:5599946-Prymnesium_polylepis.1
MTLRTRLWLNRHGWAEPTFGTAIQTRGSMIRILRRRATQVSESVLGSQTSLAGDWRVRDPKGMSRRALAGDATLASTLTTALSTPAPSAPRPERCLRLRRCKRTESRGPPIAA